MSTEHPITPPPELAEQWANDRPLLGADTQLHIYIATKAAQWGADQELKACCQSLYDRFASPVHQAQFLAQELRDWLRAARRPKPPSLKEQALARLAELESDEPGYGAGIATIRRALEALND